MCHCVVLWVCRRFAATPSRHPRRSYWNEFAAEAYSLLPFSNEGGRLLTYNGEAVIGREAMFAQAQQQHSEFLTQLCGATYGRRGTLLRGGESFPCVGLEDPL